MRHSDVSCLTLALEVFRFRTYRGLELPPVGIFGVVGRFNGFADVKMFILIKEADHESNRGGDAAPNTF
jgi:hypothetical protein